MRDEFPIKIKNTLAQRVGGLCSNPGCRRRTTGPTTEPGKSTNVGVAAHITAADVGGPRYDQSLSSQERRSPDNGIWLCQSCAKMIDDDVNRFTVKVLQNWRDEAEAEAQAHMERPGFSESASGTATVFRKLETQMSDLIDEMKCDLGEHPLRREFVVLKKDWIYNGRGGELVYYYEDHEELDGKIKILENYDLITDISYTSVNRYAISEELAEYLIG